MVVVVVVVVVIGVMIADNSMKMKYIILSYYNCITAVIHSDTANVFLAIFF